MPLDLARYPDGTPLHRAAPSNLPVSGLVPAEGLHGWQHPTRCRDQFQTQWPGPLDQRQRAKSDTLGPDHRETVLIETGALPALPLGKTACGTRLPQGLRQWCDVVRGVDVATLTSFTSNFDTHCEARMALARPLMTPKTRLVQT